MGKRIFSVVLTCLAALLILSPPAGAKWVENGRIVCTTSGVQNDPIVISDCSGGSIIAWTHSPGVSATEVYAQRLDEYGRDIWTTDGVPVLIVSSSISYMDMISDGASGAFVAVHTSDDSLRVQRIYADGTTWGTLQGAPVCIYTTPFFDTECISMAPDGGGGVILAWNDIRLFPVLAIYAQRVDASGAVKWTANGVPVCTATNFRMGPRCATDLDGGAVIAWADQRSGIYDIYAQRIDSTGTVQWTADGVAVCTAAGEQDKPRIISDGSGGVIVAWEDSRSGYEDPYLQKLDSNGIAQWPADGVQAITEAFPQISIRMVTDGEGGAILTWLDIRNTIVNTDIYAQRVSSSGAVLWGADGAPVCTAPEIQGYPMIAEDGKGGAVITWKDMRSSNADIYAQRVGPDGNPMWQEDGDTVCTGEAQDRSPTSIAYIGERGVVITWPDNRIGELEVDYRIYAQGVDFQGNWGYPSPVIHSVEDVPGDQGGYVNLFWYASVLEDLLYDEITHYTLWRAIEPQQAIAAFEAGAILVDDPSFPSASVDDRVIRRIETAAAIYFWELVGTQQAYRFPAYAMAIPTLFDSTAVYHDYHYFQVLAHRSNQDYYYASGVDSAYSVDNLSPAAPLGLAGEQSYAPEGLQLTWDPNSDADLAGYVIYRGTSGGFLPGPGNKIASSSEPALFDDEWTWDSDYWYKVGAIDVNGNESVYAELGPDMITGDDNRVPDAAFLAQNYPNPFNPSTTIAFGLDRRGHVSLRIYDTAGKLVCTLIDEVRPAGRHEAVWDGSDGSGRSVASGVYYMRLTAADLEFAKKMVLLR